MTLSKSDIATKSPRAALAGFLLLAGLVTLAPRCASAVVSFNFEGCVFYEPGEIVKDHSLILIDDTFRLFYITTDQRSFGYASSPDLRHWTLHGNILQAGPNEWDGARIWAPVVVPYPHGAGYYLMYYTGVNGAFAQLTCLAISHAPGAWSKDTGAFFTPFHGDTLWIAWNENEWSNYRDPGFFEEEGEFYLVQSAHTRSWKGTIALARSSDHFNWEDAGPLYVHDTWHALESPFLMKRAGVYHLFFTEEEVGGVSHMSSDSLRSGWDILQRSIIDGGHAAEVLDAGADRYIISRQTSYSSAAGLVSTLRFDTLRWNGDTPEVAMSSPLDDWTVLRGTAFDHQPVFGDNPRLRGDDTTEVGFEGNWWIGTYEAFAGPLTGTSPGDVQGDEARGAIRSNDFSLTGLSMRLLVGGGRYPDSCYVALCDAQTGAILYRETGKNDDRMDERLWNLYPFRGRTVYILIVDDCSCAFGHINVDGIEERMTAIAPPPDTDTRRERDRGSKIFASESLSRAWDDETALGASSLEGYPNPFNPNVDLVIRSRPGAAVAVTIYDVSGRETIRRSVRTDARGKATIRWDGRDGGGACVPSGVYLAVLKDGDRLLATAKLVLAR